VDALARQHETSHENANGNMLDWVFRELLEIQEISAETIGDGTEVFFRFLDEPSEVELELLRETHTHAWWRDDA